MTGRFIFTVTDLARFLGKSPVTLRGWERKDLIKLPRDSGDNRKLTTTDIRKVAKIARKAGRITEARYQMVLATITMLELVENENGSKSKTAQTRSKEGSSPQA